MDPVMTSVTIVAAKIQSRPIFKSFHVTPTPAKLKCLGGHIKPEVLILMHRHGGGTRENGNHVMRKSLFPRLSPANLGSSSIERA